jgi:hypothetical protein
MEALRPPLPPGHYWALTILRSTAQCTTGDRVPWTWLLTVATAVYFWGSLGHCNLFFLSSPAFFQAKDLQPPWHPRRGAAMVGVRKKRKRHVAVSDEQVIDGAREELEHHFGFVVYLG